MAGGTTGEQEVAMTLAPLRIRNLSKTYPGGVRAVNIEALDIPTGMFGLLGPNGAGKSTLMRTLATLQDADHGSVSLGDIDLLRQQDEVRRLLGYLPQEFGVYPRLTARQLLEHLAILKGVTSRGPRRDLIDGLLHQTNLYDVRHRRLGSFSGGMKQRFGIAQALIGDPKLIIVDEPTAGLDPTERNRFLNLLASVGREVIVILSTHIVEDVRELCSRMAIIDKGEVLLAGSPEAAINTFKGAIWKKSMDASELDDCRMRHRVVSTHLLGGRTEVRVHAAAPPDSGFAAAEADLRDVYFLTLQREAA
jgi:ABC-type multidrug transport system ATPase subunit